MTKNTVNYNVPFTKVNEWLSEAEAKEPNDPTAMALATATADGLPSVRMVLMKGCDERGIVFYTNLESRKGQDLQHNSQAALLFHWKSLRRQIRIEGRVDLVTPAEADAYFASRARASQIGAWASAQSRPMEGRFEFETAIAKYTAKFAAGVVPRPEHWSGYRLKPTYFEFWRDRKFRLHERVTYSLAQEPEDVPAEKRLWNTQDIYP